MPRATKNSAHVMDTSVNQENSMISQDSSSSDQEMKVQNPQCFPPSTSQPNMDWTVNDSLYHKFLKWKQKCENIPDCELALLPES